MTEQELDSLKNGDPMYTVVGYETEVAVLYFKKRFGDKYIELKDEYGQCKVLPERQVLEGLFATPQEAIESSICCSNKYIELHKSRIKDLEELKSSYVRNSKQNERIYIINGEEI